MSIKGVDFDAELQKALKKPFISDGYWERDLRLALAHRIREVMSSKHLSFRRLASKMGTSVSQVQRLVDCDLETSPTLMTIVKAARALGLEAEVRLVPPKSQADPSNQTRIFELRAYQWAATRICCRSRPGAQAKPVVAGEDTNRAFGA
jgi:transcriptional regulator with XRE-family HTH domain